MASTLASYFFFTLFPREPYLSSSKYTRSIEYLQTFSRAMDCWRFASSRLLNLTEYQTFPCASTDSSTIVPCCTKFDQCLSNNFCHYTHRSWTPYQSGYYIAGCTSQAGTDASCSQACSKHVLPVEHFLLSRGFRLSH